MLTSKPNSKLMIVGGSSHPELTSSIAKNLGIKPAKVELSKFSCGEIYARIADNVRGASAYVIQTCSANVNSDLMELFIIIDSLKRASVKNIAVVMPHFGYARQEKKSASREPISARLIADLLTAAGADRLITVELHADAIQGFFNFPVDHMTTKLLFAEYLNSLKLKDPVVVAPDTGRAKTAKKLADKINADLAIMHKTRPNHNIAEITNLVGEVKGKTAILIDDMVDTAGTITEGLKTLREAGVNQDIYLITTHAVFSGPAIERLKKAEFREVIISDTIPIKKELHFQGLKILSCASLIAEAIKRSFLNASISELFD